MKETPPGKCGKRRSKKRGVKGSSGIKEGPRIQESEGSRKGKRNLKGEKRAKEL